MFGLVLVYYLIEALKMTPSLEVDIIGPGFFPKVIGVFGLILVCILFLSSKDSKKGVGEREKKISLEYQHLTPILLLLIYVLTLEKIGFVLGTFLFLSFNLKFLGVEKWTRSLIVSAVITAVIYILFNHVMDVRTPESDIFQGLMG